MKKIALLFVCFCFTGLLFSQTNYGFRAAYNISNLDFTTEAPAQNAHRNGLAFGFFVEYDFNEGLSFMPEIQWSAEGAKAEVLKVNYVQMPLQLRAHFGNDVVVGAGPQIGLKTWSFEDGYRNIVFSGVAGIEVRLSDKFFVDARYTYGFTNIFDDETNLEAINTNIQLGIGVKMF
ncbi:MAG: PorT family protein [Bacteroidia bacterium]|nr:PorT family protein [Bacteroidia bacterium]NND26784.1 PorT family protein [Flavobacteriaceae bacterium]MBT8278727.1 PorT family protein [Bacteroidia bacterium]NNK60522.1 PorT family protein [Flavobacteriaceae bacterium]NNL32002.1 PorT family protein [Flavobacteriaceae bacterium]